MAEASALLKEIGEEFLECCICFEPYTNPKILGCVHSFCETCLVTYYGNDQVKPCPICHQETKLPVPGGVSGFKTNCFLIKLSDKLKPREKVDIIPDKAQRLCEICAEYEATHHCLNCAQNICERCMNIHLRSKATANHRVETLEDIREGENEYRCNEHEGEVNRIYCETCHVLICRDCSVKYHCNPEHQCIDCAAASSKYRQVLKKVFPNFKMDVEILKQQLEAKSKDHQYFQKNITQTAHDVNRRAERLISKVKAEEDRVIGKIRTLEENRNTTFDGQIKTMELLLQRKQHTLALATYVTTKGSDSDFLSLFPIFNQDLYFLRSQVPPQIDAKLHYIRLGQGPTPEFINLDELDLGDTKWGLRREVCKDWTLDSFVDVAALQGDKLAVISTLGQLVIFNITGGIDKVIQPVKRRYCGISASSNHIAVVGIQSSTVKVDVYNEDFTLACQFSPELPRLGLNENKVNHRCVCLKKDGNSILVGHDSRKLVTIHRLDGSLIRTIPVEIPPRFLATDSNDRVIVSGHCDNQVTVTGDQGVTLVTIKPTIDGQPVMFCSGVCCDGSDIYVAVDNIGTGHIHRYDGDGKFISCVAQGMRNPEGITFTQDGQNLAVADEKRVKIYHRV